MTSFGQYPLVYQLKQLGDGSFIPVGLAETSSLGSFSAVNIVVSSISATDYLGFEANVSFTGVLSIEVTGVGTQLIDVVTNPNIPVIRNLATPTNAFLEPSLAGDGAVHIGYGANPLSHDHGGTNNAESPVPNGVAHWYNNGGTTYLDTEVNFTFDKNNLSIPSSGKYQIGGNDLKLADIAGIASPATLNLIPPPTTTNTYLIYNSLGALSWSAVTGTGGGATLPNTPGRIPITNSTTNSLDIDSTLTFNTSTKVLSTYAINNVCDVCAIRFNEGGTLLSDKFQGKDDTLTAIASLNPTTNQLIYFNGTNTAATATVSPCALELLNDSTYADMRTTLQLNSYYQPIGAYLTAIPDQYLTQTEGDGFYQACDVFLNTLASQNYVNLNSADVCNTLPITKGGTNKTSFNADQLIFSNDFSQDSTLTFNKTTKLLNASSFSATNASANTIYEGGQTLSSKYLTTTVAAATYQVCDTFLNTLATNDSVRLDLDVTNTLGVTRGGTGFNSISNNQIVVGTGTNTIGTIPAPTGDTYLRYNGGAFAWSVIPTGTGTTLPTDPCAVVFMNTTGTALVSNKGIRVNNSASTLEIFSNLADGTGGLDIAPDIANEGFLRWDHNYDTLGIQGINNTNISLGVDDLIPIVNKTGAPISRGIVVYVSGAESAGYRGRVGLLSNTNRSAGILGVCLADIADNATGYAIKKGLIKNQNRSSIQQSGDPTWVEGDQLYVGTTAGRLTTVHPAAGNRAAKIGVVVEINGANASIGVNVDRGYDLSELHDVCATPSNNGDILVWNSAGTGYYATGTINDITGTLSVTKGGTGKTSFTANQLIYGTNFAQDSNLYYSNNVLYASAASATTNVSAGGSTYGGNASIAGFVYATGDIATLAGTVFGANVCGTNLFQGTTNINAIYQPIGSYQPNNTRLHDLTAVTVDGLLRFNGSNYVTQPTATYETTAYARGNYETTGYARSTYETTGYARNTYETTGYSRSTYETTGYSRTNFALTASLASYETTAYSRPNFATTASLASYETTAYARSTYETTGYARSTFETTGYSRSTFETTGYARTNYETTGYARRTYETTGYSRNTFALTASLANYETTANANSTYLAKTTYNSFTGTLALSAGLLDVQIATLSTGQVLKWNGLKWANANDATGTGSTGGSPGGSTTHVQVNYYNGDSNVFSGNAGLTFDLTTSTLRAQNWSNLPSGSAYWNANQLSGIPLVSALGGGIGPQDGNTLVYLESGGFAPGWYYDTAGGTNPGGSNTQIQFNNSTQFSGSPALTWNNSTSSLISNQLSATTYLNLPSGTATWNANKIDGYPVSITTNVGYDILMNNGFSQYTTANLLTLANTAAWNANKLQGVSISTTTPATGNTLTYNGTNWAPTAPTNGGNVGVSYILGNNLIL